MFLDADLSSVSESINVADDLPQQAGVMEPVAAPPPMLLQGRPPLVDMDLPAPPGQEDIMEVDMEGS